MSSRRHAMWLAVLSAAGALAMLFAAVGQVRREKLWPFRDDAADYAWPPGSKLVSGPFSTCFEHQEADGTWTPIGLITEDGRPPYRTQPATGIWYFPREAGPTRIRIGCAP